MENTPLTNESNMEDQAEQVKYKPSLFMEKPILGFCFRKDLYWLMFAWSIVGITVFAGQSEAMFHTILDQHQDSATNIFQLVICMCLLLMCVAYAIYIVRVHPLFRVPPGSRATTQDQELWYAAEYPRSHTTWYNQIDCIKCIVFFGKLGGILSWSEK